MTCLPVTIVHLLIGFFAQTLTEAQHDQLDEWMCESEANQLIFEDCLEITLLARTYHPDQDEYEFAVSPVYPN